MEKEKVDLKISIYLNRLKLIYSDSSAKNFSAPMFPQNSTVVDGNVITFCLDVQV